MPDPAPPTGLARPVYDTPHGTLHYFPDADVLWGRLGTVELRCEAGRGVALFRSPAYAERDLYLATHPLATISLMELLERRGLFALHAACLAREASDGVLLAGASGAGKSTLALALVHAGMRFLSDDIVFLSCDGESDTVTVLGFADTIGLTDYATERFPRFRALRAEPPAPGFPKRLHRIEDLFTAPRSRPAGLARSSSPPSRRERRARSNRSTPAMRCCDWCPTCSSPTPMPPTPTSGRSRRSSSRCAATPYARGVTSSARPSSCTRWSESPRVPPSPPAPGAPCSSCTAIRDRCNGNPAGSSTSTVDA